MGRHPRGDHDHPLQDRSALSARPPKFAATSRGDSGILRPGPGGPEGGVAHEGWRVAVVHGQPFWDSVVGGTGFEPVTSAV